MISLRHPAAAVAALLLPTFLSAQLLITEVVDGTLSYDDGSGGTTAAPKWIEITNTGGIAYTFSAGGIIVQTNAATDYDVDVDLTGVTIDPMSSIVVSANNANQAAAFNFVYGFDPDVNGGSATFGNGDDRYILTDASDGSNLLDIYGADGVDGTGQLWEYTDGYAARKPGLTSGNSGLFDPAEWTFGGVNSLETGDDLTEAPLILASTSPGVYAIPEVSAFGLFAGFATWLMALKRRRA